MNYVRVNTHKSEKIVNARLWLMGIVAIALVSRLIALQWATIDSADAVTKVWIAQKWLSDPHLITHGVWGPLHTYLIATAVALFTDSQLGTSILHITFGVLTLIPFYIFTRNEFSDERLSLLVTFTYALYPVAISNSLIVTSEAPFVFFLTMSLMFLSYVRLQPDKWEFALASGFCLTLASMMRYEGWMLTPLLALMLWGQWRNLLIFLFAGIVHPIFWMVGNAVEYGDPLYSVHWAQRWEQDSMGHGNLSMKEVLIRLMSFPQKLFAGMTLPVALLSITGCLIAIIQRDRRAIWLIPIVGIGALLVYSATQGELVVKTKYTVTFGTFLLPFSAIVYQSLRLNQLSRRGLLTAALVLFLTIAPFLKSAVPRFALQERVAAISSSVGVPLLQPETGFISDFFGWRETFYTSQQTGLHPDRIYVLQGAPNRSINMDKISDFLSQHKRGVLLLHSGSRFAARIQFKSDTLATIGSIEVKLDKMSSNPWPAIRNPRLGNATNPRQQSLDVYLYRVVPVHQ